MLEVILKSFDTPDETRVFEKGIWPFHNTFTWNPESKRWMFLMDQKHQTGKWKVFAEDSLRRP